MAFVIIDGSGTCVVIGADEGEVGLVGLFWTDGTVLGSWIGGESETYWDLWDYCGREIFEESGTIGKSGTLVRKWDWGEWVLEAMEAVGESGSIGTLGTLGYKRQKCPK